jgi:DNA-binding MarR family transcriptional regulator
MKNGLERIARSEGVSLSQFNILRILRGAGEPLPTMEVANRMVELEPGVTRLMGKLERSGFITRTRSRDDARVVVCSITTRGEKLLEALDNRIARLEEDLMRDVSVSEMEQLIKILSRIHCRTLAEANGTEI